MGGVRQRQRQVTWRDRLAEGGVQCLAKSTMGKDHYWQRSAEREKE